MSEAPDPTGDRSALPELHGARVTLRAMRAADVPALFAMQSDPVGMRYWSYPPLARIEQAEQLFERNVRATETGECLPWIVSLPLDDAMIGTCTLFALDTAHRRAMVGYGLDRQHWGRGYAQEALHLALGHAFGALALHRIEADIDPRNTASTRLIERVGFTREGLLRERWFVGDDIQDSVIYGLLARDYAATPTG
jgi:RimJ/RimL family protein N-acetyltransferase